MLHKVYYIIHSIHFYLLKIDVIKHLGEQFTRIKSELLNFQTTGPAMEKRLRAYAHTLLYSLEKIQKYFSRQPGAYFFIKYSFGINQH
jgi:hypothetical protein